MTDRAESDGDTDRQTDPAGAPEIIVRCSTVTDAAERARLAAILDGLLAGSRRFAAGAARPRDLVAERVAGLDGQRPAAVAVTCSDSRVAVRDIFDVPLGTIFTVRTAGAALDTAGLASLEYAVGVLETPLVLVVGHDSCGAVTAAMDPDRPPGHLGTLIDRLRRSVAGARDVDHAIDLHAVRTAAELRRSGLLGEAYARGRIAVIPLRYRFTEGRLDVLDPAREET